MSRGDAFLEEPSLEPRPGESIAGCVERLSAQDPPPGVTYETLSNCILRLLKLVDCQDTRTVAKFCQLVEKMLTKCEVRLSRKAFDAMMDRLTQWFAKCPAWTLNDLFHALGACLYGCGSMVDIHRKNLLLAHNAVLTKFLDDSYPDSDIQRLAFQCLTNMTIKQDRGAICEELQTAILKLLIKRLVNVKSPHIDDIVFLRFIVIAFEGVSSLATYMKMDQGSLGLLFAAIRYYMVLGMPGFYTLPREQFEPLKSTNIMTKMNASTRQTAFNKNEVPPPQPSLVEDDEEETSLDAKGVSKQYEDSNSYADKESGDCFDITGFSIVESGANTGSKSDVPRRDFSKMFGVCKKVRTVALTALLETLKGCQAKVTFGYWWYFIPDDSITDFLPDRYPYFYLLLKDTNVKSRTVALQCLSQFISVSRQYVLAAADDRHDPKSYTSYSYALAVSVKELHRVLLQITSSDYGFVTLPIALQALSYLILATPYHKLRLGLLSRVVKHLMNFVHSSHVQTRTAAITCLQSVAHLEPPLAEVFELFKTVKPPQGAPLIASESGRSVRSGAQTPLSSYGLAGPSSVSNSSLESLDRLRGRSSSDTLEASMGQMSLDENWVSKFNPRHLPWVLAVTQDIVFNGHPSTRESLNPDQGSLQVAAFGLLASLAMHYMQLFGSVVDDLLKTVNRGLEEHVETQVKAAALKLLEEMARSLTRVVPEEDLFWFWSQVLAGPLTVLLEAKNKSVVRASACDCMAAISPAVYEKLPHSQKMHCVVLMIGYSAEPDPHVAGAALRALGNYIQFLPSLKDDYQFITDVTHAIFNLIDNTNRYVRSRACWSLANICDNLMALSDSDPNFMSELTHPVFSGCLEACLKASEDQDRCKYNAVRGLGSLIYCIHQCHLDVAGFSDLLDRSFAAMMRLVGPCLAKVRWNACYASGLVFQNKLLMSTHFEKYIYPLICAIITTLETCSNFKVKINAVNSLRILWERDQFGDRYPKLAELCLNSLSESETLVNFDEYKHQSELQQCLCALFCQLTSLSVDGDVASLSGLITKYRQPVDISWKSFTQCEDHGPLLEKARHHLAVNGVSDNITDFFTRTIEEEGNQQLAFDANYQ